MADFPSLRSSRAAAHRGKCERSNTGTRMPDTPSRLAQHVRRWPRRVIYTVATLLLVLLVARIALPHVIKSQINQRLAAIPGYSGHVQDIDLHLWRGAYSLVGLAIYRQNGQVREPFVLGSEIDFSVAWRELFRGKIVSDIHVDTPQINFVFAETRSESQTDTDRRWQEVIQDIFPIDITHLEVDNGTIRYVDKTKEPHVDIFLKNMHVVATGLRNRAGERGREFPAEIAVEGETIGGGKVRFDVAADPLAAQPHFHLSAKLDSLSLPALNDSLKAVANVDVGRGTFQMAAEMAGKDGGFQGYVKPFFEDLDFRNIEDKEKGIGTRIWERIVAGVAWLVKNKSRDQVGTRIPFEGRFGDPQVGLLATVTNLFRHGFVRAFNPTIEGSVNPENVLPDGKSADGKDVGEAKGEQPRPEGVPATRAEVKREAKEPTPAHKVVK